MRAWAECAVFGITLIQLAKWQTPDSAVLDLAPPAVSHSVTLLAGKNRLSRLPERTLPSYRPDPRVNAGPPFPLWLVFRYLFAMDYGYTLWHAPKKTNNIHWLDRVSRL